MVCSVGILGRSIVNRGFEQRIKSEPGDELCMAHSTRAANALGDQAIGFACVGTGDRPPNCALSKSGQVDQLTHCPKF